MPPLARCATLTGPALWLRSIAISADGSTLAVAGDSRSIELWDMRRGLRSGVLAGHAQHVSEVAFAPSGAILASASSDGEIRLWDVARKTNRLVIRVDQYGARDLCFTPDGQTLAACDLKGVRFWSASDGHLVKEIRGERLGLLGFADGGRNFLVFERRGRHGQVKAVLDGATQSERFVARAMSLSLPKLSPDSRAIAFGDWSGSVSVVDAVSGRELVKAVGLKGDIRCLAFSPDGKLLAAGDEGGTVCVWDAGTGKLRTRFGCYSLARHWSPPAAAIVVFGLATLRLRRRRQSGGRTRVSRLWDGIRRRFPGRTPTPTQSNRASPVLHEGRTAIQVDAPAKPEPMWDYWLDGS